MVRRLAATALLAVPLATLAPAAHAGCDPETGECHPCDPVAWDPVADAKAAAAQAKQGNVAGAVDALFPSSGCR